MAKFNDAFWKWFGDSKVIDDNGDPLVVYHGTPNAGFAKFKDGSHFTESPEYAYIYAEKAIGRNENKPFIYPVYLSIQKPFDTRKTKERKLFYKDFFEQRGNGAELSEHKLPDWTDGTDLMEWIEEENLPYDGIILDEQGLPWRGISFVPFYSNQIKSAIGNDGSYDLDDNDIRSNPRRRR